MCLIVHRFGGSNLPNDVIDINKRRNSDGFGISWRDANGGLHFAKYAPSAFDKFHKQLKRIDRQPAVEYVAHFRFATTGAPCRDLSHPFVYEDENEGPVHVFHNGIIDIKADKGESDTSQFVKSVLSKMPSGWWRENHFKYLVEGAIGASRMLLMTKSETIYLNRGSWYTQDGLRYSTDAGGSHSKWQGGTSGKGGWTNGDYQPHATVTPGVKDVTTKYLPTVNGQTGSGIIVPSPVAQAIEIIGGKGDERSCDVYEALLPDDIQSWLDRGHEVESLGNRIPDGEDGEAEVVCLECQTMGVVYIVNGDTYIDIAHDSRSWDDDSDEEDFDTLSQFMSDADKRAMMQSYK